jgi:hypothetical protein
MKNVGQIPAGKSVADADAPKDQTEHEPEPVTDVDSVMEEIHLRANSVGPVLEEILQANLGRASWDRRV